MSHILITNDDGIDAPALVPLARALSRFGDVLVVAPSGERSWIGKAISRHDPVAVRRVDREGFEMWAADGYPADCVHIGAFGLRPDPPRVVVSGINMGSNRGSAFVSGSGTIGAAIEASNLGLPGLAFSAMSRGIWTDWVDWAHTPAAGPMWERLAGIAADVVATVLELGLPSEVDALSVNLPDAATRDTPRRVTGIARTHYSTLFTGDGHVFRHTFDGVLYTDSAPPDSDMTVLDAGEVSITPIRMASVGTINRTLRAALENKTQPNAGDVIQ